MDYKENPTIQAESAKKRDLIRSTSFMVGVQNGVKHSWFAQLFAIIGAILLAFCLFFLKTMYLYSELNNWESVYAMSLFGCVFTLILLQVKKLSAFDLDHRIRNKLACNSFFLGIGISCFVGSLTYLSLGRASLLVTLIPILIGLL
jgi:uncharacterized membrane protein YgdD (TMEM256/DUF423 family)